MKPVTDFTASARNTWCGNASEERTHGYCVIRHGYCDGYPTTKKDQQALRFLFRHGNSVESESLELELESTKPSLATCCLVNEAHIQY